MTVAYGLVASLAYKSGGISFQDFPAPSASWGRTSLTVPKTG